MSTLDDIEKGKVVRLKDLNRATRDELRELDGKQQAVADRFERFEALASSIDRKIDNLKAIEQRLALAETSLNSLQTSSDSLRTFIVEEARKVVERRLSDPDIKRKIRELASDEFDEVRKIILKALDDELLDLHVDDGEINVKLWATLKACVFLLEHVDVPEDRKKQYNILLKNTHEITDVMEEHTENDEQYNAIREGKWKEYRDGD